MHATIHVSPPQQRRQGFAARRRAFNPWLVATVAACCAVSPRFVGLSRMDIGVAHAAGLVSGQNHPAAAVVTGLVGSVGAAGTAATGAVGAATGAVGAAAMGAVGATTGAVDAATSATGAAASGAVGATTGAIGATTGAAGAAAKGAVGATTSTVGAVTDTVGTAATNTVGAATNAISTATTTIGTAATGTLNATTGAIGGVVATAGAVNPTLALDDTNALAALQASGFVTPNGDPILLKASWVDSTGEPCRKYVQRVMVNHAAVQATAVVCKRPWGTWHVITPVLGARPLPQQAAER